MAADAENTAADGNNTKGKYTPVAEIFLGYFTDMMTENLKKLEEYLQDMEDATTTKDYEKSLKNFDDSWSMIRREIQESDDASGNLESYKQGVITKLQELGRKKLDIMDIKEPTEAGDKIPEQLTEKSKGKRNVSTEGGKDDNYESNQDNSDFGSAERDNDILSGFGSESERENEALRETVITELPIQPQETVITELPIQPQETVITELPIQPESPIQPQPPIQFQPDDAVATAKGLDDAVAAAKGLDNAVVASERESEALGKTDTTDGRGGGDVFREGSVKGGRGGKRIVGRGRRGKGGRGAGGNKVHAANVEERKKLEAKAVQTRNDKHRIAELDNLIAGATKRRKTPVKETVKTPAEATSEETPVGKKRRKTPVKETFKTPAEATSEETPVGKRRRKTPVKETVKTSLEKLKKKSSAQTQSLKRRGVNQEVEATTEEPSGAKKRRKTPVKETVKTPDKQKKKPQGVDLFIEDLFRLVNSAKNTFIRWSSEGRSVIVESKEDFDARRDYKRIGTWSQTQEMLHLYGFRSLICIEPRAQFYHPRFTPDSTLSQRKSMKKNHDPGPRDPLKFQGRAADSEWRKEILTPSNLSRILP